MKTFSMLSLTLGMALVLGTSCGNTEEGARATPIDSTNETGAAPVQYPGGVPDGQTDSTMQTSPYDKRARQDNANERSMQEAQGASGNNQPVESNTTDPKTTSGSDRK